MTYLDTSVLVAAYVSEAKSQQARRLLASTAQPEFVISDWSRTEFSSAIGINVRMNRLDKKLADQIVQAFKDLADRALILVHVQAPDFTLADQYLRRFDLGLRAGDALHLAIASNHGAEIYSSDEVMLKGARRLGIKAHELR